MVQDCKPAESQLHSSPVCGGVVLRPTTSHPGHRALLKVFVQWWQWWTEAGHCDCVTANWPVDRCLPTRSLSEAYLWPPDRRGEVGHAVVVFTSAVAVLSGCTFFVGWPLSAAVIAGNTTEKNIMLAQSPRRQTVELFIGRQSGHSPGR